VLEALDYDLNIYRRDVGVFEYRDPWYIDIYIYENDSQKQVGTQIELTPAESIKLHLGSGYFNEDDSWYGLEGFLKDYEHQISDRLWSIFNALPTHKEG
jgi:hypothetical protein